MERAGWWANSRGEGYVAAQAVLMLLVAGAPFYDPARWSPHILLTGAGMALGVVGAVLALGGVASLGRNLTPMPKPKEGAVLVESGLYALVRHPIYAGIGLAGFGWALAWRSPIALALAILLLAFFDIKARREERWLVQAYPGYADYRRRVAKLIPFLY